MTDRSITAEENVKAGVHLTGFGLFAMMFGYNAMKYAGAHEWRHLINVAIYGAMLVHESRQVRYHFQSAALPHRLVPVERCAS